MHENIKLALGVCHYYDAAGHILRFSKFTFSINYFITPHTINPSNTDIESQINDAIDALFEDLYPTIVESARNFDVPNQTLQRKINKIDSLSSRSPTNKALSET